MKKLKATVENLLAHPDELDKFQFKFGPIVCTKLPNNVYDHVNIILFGELNFFKSFAPNENLSSLLDKLQTSRVFQAMRDKCYHHPKYFNSKGFNTSEEAMIYLNLNGFSNNEITIIDAHDFC